MSKKKRDDFAPDIVDEYRYQAEKRSSWDWQTGLPDAAASGDHKSLRKCAGMALVLIKRWDVKPEHVGVVAWVESALSMMYSGESPNEAFGWNRRGAHRPRTFETVFREWLIGRHYWILRLRYGKALAARQEVMQSWGLSDGTVKDIARRSVGFKTELAGMTAAELEAEAASLAAYGAEN